MNGHIIRIVFIHVILFGCVGFPAEQPNILLILVDDVGYADVGAFSARINNTSTDKLYTETPRIDQLARQGTMFTQFYACTVCAPTRASLMTGKMNNRMGMWDAYAGTRTTFEKTQKSVPDGCHILDHEPLDEYRYKKADRAARGMTIPVAATALHDVKTIPQGLEGYDSAFIGKWHMGSHNHEGYRPEDQGFDETLAYFDGGGSGYHRPFRAYAARTTKWDEPGPDLTPRQDYLSDDVAQRVNRFLDDRAGQHPDTPFFLYLAHPAAHGPIQSRADDLAYFEKKAKMPGLIGHKSPEYAGLIKGMDRSIGHVLDKLDELKLTDSTAVIFISDNGGHPVFTRNAPLRGGKSMLYEGGIRVPMIVRWPGRTRADAVCDVTSDIADIYPTLMEIAGVDYSDFKADTTTDGESLVPLFSDLKNAKNRYDRDAFYHFYGKLGYGGFHNFATWAALRKGDFKLHYDYQGKVELYDIARDISEKHDLVNSKPKMALDMLVQLTDWLRANCDDDYLPKPNPEYDPKATLRYGPYVRLEPLKASLMSKAGQPKYRDGRPATTLRMDAQDHGIILRYGDGPGKCDRLGARDVWVFEDGGTYYMHYDAAGPKGWLSSLAVSKDLSTWEKKGPILDFGKPGEDDSAGACYGVTYKDGNQWHMFYLGTPNVSPAPDLVPSFPYLTMKAKSSDPAGPWIKQKDVIPFRTKPGTYYSLTASPGQVIKHGEEYLQFFSATTRKAGNPCVQRTLGIARTQDLDGAWTVDPTPMVPIEEQIENSTLYYEQSNQTWFLFTNHIGIDKGEYTDAIWVYWSKDLNTWNAQNKAIVLDGQNCHWSKTCIGLPSVVQVGKRLALFYDAPGGNSTSHMKRHIGLAWLDLPLSVPASRKVEIEVSETDSLKPADLRCEYLDNPLGIDVVKPRVSWKLDSDQRGQKQTAYRLIVASSSDKLNRNTGDLWDSGKVKSDQSIHVAYNGKALKSRTRCFWKVMVWGKDGNASAWSEPAMWSMGLLEPEDWSAQWIGVTPPLKGKDVTITKASYQTLDASVAVDVTAIAKQELAKNKPLRVDFKTFGGDPARGIVKELVVEYIHEGKPGITRAKDFETLKWIGTAEAQTSPFFRQSFRIDELPERATIYVAPLGYFELYINGQKIGDEVLAPAVSNFSKRSYYRTYDVAETLKKGVNSLGIWMGTGWYSPGLPGVKHDSPVVRAQLELSGNGIERTIATDTAWQTKPSARKLLGEWRWGKFGGEQVDARQIDEQWWRKAKSKTGWTQAVEVDVADVPCTAQSCAGNVELSVIKPKSVESLDKDTILVDFGTNLTGLMTMTFRNLKPGQTISLYYGDLDGRQKDEAWRAKQTRKGFAVYGQFDEFISAGAAEEQFSNVFNYHAFRYVLIEGLPYVPDKADMAALPVETQVAETGTFTCSNELYNRIHTMVRWTYRCLNLGGQTVDCPHRERLGYGDGQTIMDTGCFNFDAASLYAKWSWNWWDEQTDDGFVPFTAPCPHSTGGGPAWGAMCIMVPWKTYLFNHDHRLLEQGYPYMKKYVDYLDAHCKDGILQDMFPGERWPNLGDWVPPRRGMDKKDWVEDRSRRFFNNCYRVHLLQIMQTIAGLLDQGDDVKAFEQSIHAAQKKIHATWFNEEDNTYANGEQPYLIFPLQTGVTPEPLRKAVFERYCETLLDTDKGHLNTGMIGTQLMVDYLLEIDRNDLVDTFVNKTTFPGWGYMVEKGATTCWEQWNGYYSQIHSCFPYIGGWFYRGLAGIRWDPETPGFKHVILRPALVKSVDWVTCSTASPYGKIISKWKLENGSFMWDISVPANSTATVHVPAQDLKSVREGGNTLQEADAVIFLRMESGRAVLRVESGTYTFTSEYDRGNN